MQGIHTDVGIGARACWLLLLLRRCQCRSDIASGGPQFRPGPAPCQVSDRPLTGTQPLTVTVTPGVALSKWRVTRATCQYDPPESRTSGYGSGSKVAGPQWPKARAGPRAGQRHWQAPGQSALPLTSATVSCESRGTRSVPGSTLGVNSQPSSSPSKFAPCFRTMLYGARASASMYRDAAVTYR